MLSMSSETVSAVKAADLARIAAFQGLPPGELEWLASLMWEQALEQGQILTEENSPADRMFVLLEGSLRAREESSPGSVTFLLEAGEVTGMLPFSRMQTFPVTVRAIGRCRVACLSISHFDAMMQRLPELGRRLVGIMSDRIRRVTHEEVQRDRLAALGRLSAGLSHSLNNPAAALLRTSENVRGAVAEWRAATVRLECHGLTPEQRKTLEDCEQECVRDLRDLPVLDSLARSDREEQLAQILKQQGVAEPWRVCPVLAECGFEPGDLSCIADAFPREALPDVLARFASTLIIERMLSEMSTSARRISELVQSMKDYSFMDQAPVQDVSVHRGLDDTLTVLHHRICEGIKVTRQYDPEVRKVIANGSELNQVWTALLENAIDAIKNSGDICIRTQAEGDRAMIEIMDTGSGIPPEIQDRIFDPFFTTKREGEGNGLGLDIAFRIVRRHQGDIRFESAPGCTRFQVRLPLREVAAGSAA